MMDKTFYRGDKVLYKGNICHVTQRQSNAEKTSVGNPTIIHMECATKNLTLIQRGNHFKLQAGLPLEFENFIDEVKFWKELGLLEEVKNPETNEYTWTLEEARSALEKGKIDLYLVSTNLPGMPPDTAHYGAYWVIDRSIADRLREQCLEELPASLA